MEEEAVKPAEPIYDFKNWGMKKRIFQMGVVLFVGTLLLTNLACEKATQQNESYDAGTLNTSALRLQIQSSALSVLDQKEKESLLYMREEEKMARDVYITLGKKWNTRIFDNISSAEQTHMDAVLLLLNKYSITDPVGNNGIGVFINARLQALYNELVKKGSLSLALAYEVGATIEDVDIYDLKQSLTYISSDDVKLVYGNLQKASENHMRAFNRNIMRLGGIYTPQYLTQAEVDAIING